MDDLCIGIVEHTMYENDISNNARLQGETAFLHNHGVDYDYLTADGEIAQLIIKPLTIKPVQLTINPV